MKKDNAAIRSNQCDSSIRELKISSERYLRRKQKIRKSKVRDHAYLKTVIILRITVLLPYDCVRTAFLFMTFYWSNVGLIQTWTFNRFTKIIKLIRFFLLFFKNRWRWSTYTHRKPLGFGFFLYLATQLACQPYKRERSSHFLVPCHTCKHD